MMTLLGVLVVQRFKIDIPVVVRVSKDTPADE